MKWYNMKRGSGKTKKLIELSGETGATIVTLTNVSSKYTMQLAKELGIDIPKPITYTDLLNDRTLRTNGVLFDEIQLYFDKLLSRYNVIAVTSTLELDGDKNNES